MSLTAQGRGTFVLPVEGLGILGRGALGPSGSQRVFAAFSLPSSFVNNTGPPSELTPSSVRGLALAAVVADLQSKGAIKSASLEPGFYSRLFVTPKVTGGWRPVINLSRLNRFVRLSPFCMETAQSVLQSLRWRDWMVSLDLQDACLQVPVHPESRRYLRFCIGPRTFQFRALCFGLSSAPQVFTRVMAPISSIMHRHGFRILRYLDDWLILGSSREEIVRERDFLLSLCDQLGVLVNLDKSSLLPSQTIDYLGMSLHTSPLRAFPTQTRIQKVISLVRVHLLTCTTSSTLEVPLGSHVISDSPHSGCSALDAVPPVALEDCRSLPVELGSDLLGRLLPPGSSVVVRCQSSRGNASSAPPPVHRRVRYRLRSHSAQTTCPACGLRTSRYSISHRELLAVLYAPRGFLHLLRGQSVSLFTDNTSALAYLRKQGGTRSSTLNSVAQAILRLCEANYVLLLPQFVPGKLNVIADSLSCDSQVLGSEWTLCQEVCRDLFRCWPVIIDLLTTSVNHRFPVYFSPVVEPQVLATDAMSQCWDALQAYAFPPFGFILNVLAKIRQSRNLEVTLVALYWPLKPWFPDILELVVDVPVLLPLLKDLLRQPHFHNFHRNLPVLHMTGFRIASEQRAILASLRQWRANLPSAAGLPPA